MAKALVIGSTGLIGSSIVSVLLAKGHEVTTMSREFTTDNLKHTFIDFSKPINFGLYNWEFDIAFICFGISGETECKKDLFRSSYINLYQTKQLIQYLDYNGTRFVYFSSSAVLGGLTRNAPVGSHPKPKGVYARQKLEIENYILDNSKCSNIIRTGKVLGNEFPLIQFWQTKLREGKKIDVFQNKHIAPVESVALANQLEQSLDFKKTIISQFSAADDISYSEIALALFSNLHIRRYAEYINKGKFSEDLQNQYESLEPSGIFSELTPQSGRDTLRKFKLLSTL